MCAMWHTVASWGAKAHVQPCAWEVGFDCWECSYMPKVVFGSLIVGQNVFGTDSWNAWARGCTRGHRGAVAHVQPSAWEVDFDCWECSHMPKLILGALLCGKMCLHGQVGTHVHVAPRGHRGGRGTCSTKCMGVGFDCWECSHMPKVIFGSLIVGKMCLARTSWNAWACGGTRGTVGTCSTKCMGS
ncbi:hypothetical protein FNV43_RR20624 [Rhamnella rubrinervis]|uniref:Uncharacterized protein n=1 Tax=Rhamnella rubrinervis TaxID=2594499 RepID=A0A8K0E0Q1_9ROSA|nr:hypothetical protein FNV43_RR20624 [Rhamnella rubrinervis]